ncbi:hypothetical protein FE257_003530 [Aspergillus nanangensis]|uniref:Potassium channel tetramerisation-type BTB domain-containing protein n=1 Tax=Aspergillus nanangensis TaxID=2582783 RepID=A0AAD4GPI0_ASPNN|nr:hypothetical protein FE257_003530 [Aspergillus nanangensis]
MTTETTPINLDSRSETPSQQSSVCTLPREKVFSIQIGTDLFRLSGASIASDAPSYFSHFFEEQLCNFDGQNIRTLYIDRDPCTFKEIARHLQGYHVRPKDGEQFVKLFADAQFYNLPRLISQLFESEIIIQIGDRNFQIPRDIFSGPGDSPNFFSLGFGAFFASPAEIFPGLNRHGLLRPPAITPPTVPNRSGDIFAELLHLLRGYPLQIRNETHRAELLRDCRYFHLRGLEQKLIPHDIRFNTYSRRSEIVMRVEDVRRSGVQVPDEKGPTSVEYARPFVDEKPYDLILEIGNEETLFNTTTMQPEFLNLTKSRFASLVQVIADKAGIPKETQKDSEVDPLHRVIAGLRLIVTAKDADLTLDGQSANYADAFVPGTAASDDDDSAVPAKRRRVEAGGTQQPPNWVIRNSQWRLSVLRPQSAGQPVLWLDGVKLDAWTTQRERNKSIAFLGS